MTFEGLCHGKSEMIFVVRHEVLNLETYWDAIYTELMDMGRTIQSLELQTSRKKFTDSSNFQTIICLAIHLQLLC